MSERMRIAVIGGSGASTPEFMDALAGWPAGEGRRPPLEIVLQGRSGSKLELVAEACRQRLPETASDVVVKAEVELDAALDGARVILVQVRIGGLDARMFDETFPRAHGIPGEETMGPGGFANAMRTIPALATLWDALRDRATDAFIIDLTNPAGIVTQAATAHTGLRIVAVCDGPVTFVDAIAGATGRDAATVRLAYAGMNHVGFWWDPDVSTMQAALGATKGIEPDDIIALGALPTPYVRFYLHPREQLAGQMAATEGRAQELKRLESRMLQQYSAGVDPGQHSRRGALWYGVSIVPLIDAIANGADEVIVLGLPNEGSVSWAPADATVELPTDVEPGGDLRRRPAVELPGPVTDLLARHGRFESMTARALAGTRSQDDVRARRPALVEALAANPMVDSADLAERLVDEILAASPA